MSAHFATRLKEYMRSAVWFLMTVAAVITMINLYLFPLLEIITLNYRPNAVGCNETLCVVEAPCIIDGSIMGKDFGNVADNYALPFGAVVASLHFLLLLRICGPRVINSVFGFFCLFVLPARFTNLILQIVEFRSVGGDLYARLIYHPKNYQCDLFSGDIDAVTLLHSRFIFLVVDFITLHVLIVTVPLYFLDEESLGISAHKKYLQIKALEEKLADFPPSYSDI